MKIYEALNLLGGEFSKMSVSGNLASNKSHSLCFRYSKFYKSQNVWWTSEYPERLDAVDFIMIALENKGILIIPPSVIKEYWNKCNVGWLKNGRRKIRFKYEEDKISLYNNADQPSICIEEFLVQKF